MRSRDLGLIEAEPRRGGGLRQALRIHDRVQRGSEPELGLAAFQYQGSYRTRVRVAESGDLSPAQSYRSRDTGISWKYLSVVELGIFAPRMSPVPNFDARGLLPPYIGDDGTTHDRSPYDATMTEVVTAFGTTSARRKLLAELVDYRALLISLGYDIGIQFVDGSFVENVEAREGRDPGDIDVFSFLQRPDRYRQDPRLWANAGVPEWQSEIIDHVQNKRRFGLDTYAVAVDQCGIYGAITLTAYWYSLFSHKRVTHDWKGFLRIRLDATDDAAARALLVSNNA